MKARLRWVRATDLLAIIATLWGVLIFVPGTFWIHPKQVFINNSSVDVAPKMTVERSVYRNTLISYQVTLRKIGTTRPVCDATSNPFLYHKERGTLEEIDWLWWTGYEKGCWPLEPGSYVADTCWTIPRPFWGITFPKTVCITSNVFTITAVSPEQAEEVIRNTETIQSEIKRLSDELDLLEQRKQIVGD